jgi:hypothetical protein
LAPSFFARLGEEADGFNTIDILLALFPPAMLVGSDDGADALICSKLGSVGVLADLTEAIE